VRVSVVDGVSRGRRVGDLPEFPEPTLQLNDLILCGQQLRLYSATCFFHAERVYS
jgi:hypothetical protein